MPDITYAGVDGCRAGWFAVGFDGNGRHAHGVYSTFGELARHFARASLILVDIPIGLPEGAGGRACDPMARRMLDVPARKSSVFPVPTRQASHQARSEPRDRQAASDVEYAISGKRLNAQTFNIAPKIAEVDEVMRERGLDASPRIREVHPELLFWAMNDRRAMPSNKKTAAGRRERLRVLERIEPMARDLYKCARGKHLRKYVALDDILDALVAAVTAYRGRGELKMVPKNPPTDPKGLPMEMVYWTPD